MFSDIMVISVMVVCNISRKAKNRRARCPSLRKVVNKAASEVRLLNQASQGREPKQTQAKRAGKSFLSKRHLFPGSTPPCAFADGKRCLFDEKIAESAIVSAEHRPWPTRDSVARLGEPESRSLYDVHFRESIQVLNLGEMELFSFFADDSGKLTYRLADCIGDQ
jgi:hypothetical protein